MNRLAGITLAAALAATAPAVLADDVSGVDRILCSAGNVTVCGEGGDCEKGPAYQYNIPLFVEIDLTQKRLSTTKASGENRITEIKNLRREDGSVIVQGSENGRAFSFVIDEATGILSAAVAGNGFSVAVFGACTPLARTK